MNRWDSLDTRSHRKNEERICRRVSDQGKKRFGGAGVYPSHGIAEENTKMIFQGVIVDRVLRSLLPRGPEDLAILRFLIYCAQLIQRAGHTDLSLNRGEAVAYRDPQAPQIDFDIPKFISGLPEASKKYFYGLIEAVDIYQSIKGRSLHSDTLRVDDPTVHELRQIRDMCLDDGLRSVY